MAASLMRRERTVGVVGEDIAMVGWSIGWLFGLGVEFELRFGCGIGGCLVERKGREGIWGGCGILTSGSVNAKFISSPSSPGH